MSGDVVDRLRALREWLAEKEPHGEGSAVLEDAVRVIGGLRQEVLELRRDRQDAQGLLFGIAARAIGFNVADEDQIPDFFRTIGYAGAEEVPRPRVRVR